MKADHQDTPASTEGWVVNVVEDATGEVVSSMPAKSERDAERIQRGIEINMNHDEYTCSVVGPASNFAA